jgi:hypothetical protein
MVKKGSPNRKATGTKTCNGCKGTGIKNGAKCYACDGKGHRIV